MVFENGIRAPEDAATKTGLPCGGALIAPARYGETGWEYYNWNPAPEKGQQETFRALEMIHLYHASGSPEDYDMIDGADVLCLLLFSFSFIVYVKHGLFT